MQADTQAILVWFTKREDSLLLRVAERGLALPERLLNWRFWIADPVIYLNELSNLVEQNEQRSTLV